jgi:hypothetical protein
MSNGTVDIIKNGYVYTNNFTIGIAPTVDSIGNSVTVKKQDLEFVLTNTAGINVTNVIPSSGAFNILTGVWTLPEIVSDQNQYLSFMATVTDESLSPYEVALEGTVLPGDTDSTNNSKIITLGGISKGDLLAELSGLEGPAGASNVLTIGTITTGVASASITGTSPSQVLNLVLPEPVDGDNLTVGTVTTLAAGSSATAVITGSSPSKVLSLGIPQGVSGALTDLSITSSIDVNGNVNQTNGNNIQITFDVTNTSASPTDRDLVFLTTLPDGFEYTSTGAADAGVSYSPTTELVVIPSGLAAAASKSIIINVDLSTQHSGAGGILKRVKIQPVDSRGLESSLTAWNSQVVRVFNV